MTILLAALVMLGDELPIPPDLAPHIKQSIALGKELYSFDTAAERGTDALAAKIGEPGSEKWNELGGYLPVHEGDAWTVLFLTREKTPRIRYRIQVSTDRKTPSQVEALQPPKDLPAATALMFRARQAAIAAIGKAEQPLNPVVLPAQVIGARGIVVYLLAGTNRNDVVVLGRHYRVLVAEDGKTVRKVEPLSKTIIEISKSDIPKGGRAAAITVTHVVTDWPLETHVFASLLHKLPVVVGTARGIWQVTGDRIALLSDRPDGR